MKIVSEDFRFVSRRSSRLRSMFCFNPKPLMRNGTANPSQTVTGRKTRDDSRTLNP